MSYPPYGGGGGYPPNQYPPQQPGGYPPQQPGGYPPQQPGGYPPQQPGGYPMGQQPYPGGAPPGGSYPPQPGMPQAQPYPGGGGGYPQAGGYPPAPGAPGFGGMPTPESAQAAAGAPGHSGYPAQSTGYPSYPGQPGGPPPPAQYPSGSYPSQGTPYGQMPAPMHASGTPYPAQPYGSVPPPAASYQPPPGSTLPPPQAQPPRSTSPYGGAGYSAVPAVTSQMGHMSLKQQKNSDIADPSKMATASEEQGTIKAKPNFDGQQEAEILRKAMKGLGTDEKAIIHVLTSCNNQQRVGLAKDFKTMFGRDLIKDFKSELSGKLEKIVVALMQNSAQFDANELKRAMKGVGTDEAALIEIMCTRTNAEIQAINVAYKKEHGKELEKALKSETSGHFQRLMISMSAGGRDESPNVDVAKAQADAKALLDAGEKQWGTDESRFNVILASRSYAQLRATFDEYGKMAKRDIEKSIKSEMSGDLEKGMLTIVRVVRNKAHYFAEQLYKSMKGLGTDDDTLIRVIVSRCEKDMVQIKQAFQATYQQSLGKFIADDTSGDYKKILLALVGGES